jgi:uncharacterized protein (DUF1697 family)
MPRYVAFLRAINVGGAHTVKMQILRQVFEGLGFSNVTSFIASGNLIFETPAREPSALEERIEGALLQALGIDATPFIRTGLQLSHIAGFNAFPASRIGAGDESNVIFLSTRPGARVKAAFKAFHSEAEEFHVHGREIYWLRHRTPEGIPYSILALSRVLAEPFTVRSMNTVRKISEKYFASE